MWAVYEKKSASKSLKRAPKEVLSKYEAWKRIVELSGPQGLKSIRGFIDEALRGQWKGYRSSRLGLLWRVIYKLEKDAFAVYIFEISPHKY